MSKRKSFWELVGKISVLLVAVATAISIWTHFFPSAEEIEVIANCRAYSLPPDFLNMLVEFRKGEDSSNIEDYLLTKQMNYKLDLTEDQISAVSSIIERLWDDFLYRIQKYEAFINLNIKNTGSISAEKITLDLPVSGIALITRQDDSQRAVKFDKKIKLDDIRPRNNIEIAIWSEEHIFRIDEDEFHLSHANGVGEFRFGRTVYGILGIFGANPGIFVILFLGCGVMLIAFGFLLWENLGLKIVKKYGSDEITKESDKSLDQDAQ